MYTAIGHVSVEPYLIYACIHLENDFAGLYEVAAAMLDSAEVDFIRPTVE